MGLLTSLPSLPPLAAQAGNTFFANFWASTPARNYPVALIQWLVDAARLYSSFATYHLGLQLRK